MLNLPSELTRPVVISDQVASKVMLDLTVYLVGPSEQELEFLIDLYERICPVDRRTKYKIEELEFWPEIARPVLTASARAASARGVSRPYLEPVRRRIRDGRSLEFALWDGHPIDDPGGSWSFSCRRIHLEASGLHAFVRVLLPLGADHKILRGAAHAIAEHVEFHSGHGGLAFVYDPWLKLAAFDKIYGLSRRFWGVDVEDLNGSLPLMGDRIKGINWITMLGRQFTSEPDIEEALGDLDTSQLLSLERRQHGCVIMAGPSPAVGDQHNLDGSMDPYLEVAKAVGSLLLDEHPDFPGQGFIDGGNTVGWLRRFVEPDGWR